MAKLIIIHCLEKKKKLLTTYQSGKYACKHQPVFRALWVQIRTFTGKIRAFFSYKKQFSAQFHPFPDWNSPPLSFSKGCLYLIYFFFWRIQGAKKRKDLSFCSVQNKNESRTSARPLNSHPRAGSARASVALAPGPARAGFFQKSTPQNASQRDPETLLAYSQMTSAPYLCL